MSEEKPTIPAGAPVDRIVGVATDLFFRQGYRATGVNEVIAKSGVAKATFYSHFKSKDELCQQYLKDSSKVAMRYVDKAIEKSRSPLTKFMAPIRSMEPLMLSCDFRGCAFMNMATEVPDFSNPLRREGVNLYDSIGQRLIELSKNLVDSNPEKYGALDPTELAKSYHVILAGAVALAELYSSTRPIDEAERAVQLLIAAGKK